MPTVRPQKCLRSPQDASGGLSSLLGSQRASDGFKEASRRSRAFKGIREPMRASGSLRRPKRRLSEGPEALGRPERTSKRPSKTDGWTDVWKLPSVSYRNLFPLGPLPCFNLSKDKRRPRASNGQQYPLPCCAHFRFPKCVQQGRGYR